MADQRTDAAERSAHVTRGEVAEAEALCCVCRASWRLCSYAGAGGSNPLTPTNDPVFRAR